VAEGKEGRARAGKGEGMAECGRGKGKGLQSADWEEGKNESVWQWLKERMAERAGVEEGKDGRASVGKDKRMTEPKCSYR
jgi:hypothetical protein